MGPRRAERKVTDQMQIEKFGCVFCSVFFFCFLWYLKWLIYRLSLWNSNESI